MARPDARSDPRAPEPPPVAHPTAKPPVQRPVERAPLAHALPMRPNLHRELPRDLDRYAAEMKWDGVRALVHAWGGQVRVRNRLGRDITRAYPELRAMGAALARPAVLDGEIIALDARGRPSFHRLQSRLSAVSQEAIERGVRETPVVFVAFDVLHLDGVLTTGLPYRERRALLESLELDGPSWTTPPVLQGPRAGLLDAARRLELEGIVLKRLDSLYVPGQRSDAWRKIKARHRQEFVVGGWVPGRRARGGTLGSILVGYHDAEGRLRYAGSVGTGFTEETLARLRERLQSHQRAASPFVDDTGKKGAVFVDPMMVVEVEFAEWTAGGRLRHPSFQGVREDVDPRAVVREERDD